MIRMTGRDLRTARLKRGWSQIEAAARLGVSQAYLAMLESGKRGKRLSPRLARRVMRLYDLPPTVLPPSGLVGTLMRADAETLARQLAALGYPGFAYLRPRGMARRNPAEVLLVALAQEDLEPRVVEALPWLLLQYWNLDRTWLAQQAKPLDLQNRVGFVVGLARQLAERTGDENRVRVLRELEAELERSRLAREDTLCRALMPDRERQWLMERRPPEARHWNLLTDWRPEFLPYAT